MSKANNTAVKSFNLNHSSYDIFRPSFSPRLVDKFLVDLKLATPGLGSLRAKFQTNKAIVELAAGTGKFTKNLVDNGWNENLVVVEPSVGMLKSFNENFPQIKSYEGNSYSLPFDDSSIDSVIIAQAYHWFSDAKSLTEIKRVLKPSGTLGLIWNLDLPKEPSFVSIEDTLPDYEFIFDEASVPKEVIETAQLLESELPTKIKDKALKVAEVVFNDTKWTKEVTSYIYGFDGSVPQYRKGEWRKSLKETNDFNPINKESFIFYDLYTKREDVYKYWETRSYITDLSEEKKLEIKQKIDELLDEHVIDTDKRIINDEEFLRKTMGTHAVALTVRK